eukprot:gene20303-24311_t
MPAGAVPAGAVPAGAVLPRGRCLWGQCLRKLLMQPIVEPNEIELMIKLTKRNPWFSKLEVNVQREVCRCLKYRNLEAGAPLFKKGDYGDAFYIVLSGRLVIQDPDTQLQMSLEEAQNLSDKGIDFRNGKVLKICNTGDSFGELALLDDSKKGVRAASIFAMNEAELMMVTKTDFQLVSRVASLSDVTTKINFLRNMPIFNQLTQPQIGVFACFLENASFVIGSQIVREKDAVSKVYFVASGMVKIASTCTTDALPLKSIRGPKKEMSREAAARADAVKRDPRSGHAGSRAEGPKPSKQDLKEMLEGQALPAHEVVQHVIAARGKHTTLHGPEDSAAESILSIKVAYQPPEQDVLLRVHPNHVPKQLQQMYTDFQPGHGTTQALMVFHANRGQPPWCFTPMVFHAKWGNQGQSLQEKAMDFPEGLKSRISGLESVASSDTTKQRGLQITRAEPAQLLWRNLPGVIKRQLIQTLSFGESAKALIERALAWGSRGCGAGEIFGEWEALHPGTISIASYESILHSDVCVMSHHDFLSCLHKLQITEKFKQQAKMRRAWQMEQMRHADTHRLVRRAPGGSISDRPGKTGVDSGRAGEFLDAKAM